MLQEAVECGHQRGNEREMGFWALTLTAAAGIVLGLLAEAEGDAGSAALGRPAGESLCTYHF